MGRLSMDSESHILTTFVICFSVMLALSMLGGFHMYLVLTNQTTIEFQFNMGMRREARKKGELYRNPFDLGRRRNFQEVFGPSPFIGFRWMLPCLAQRPAGNGMDFPSLRAGITGIVV